MPTQERATARRLSVALALWLLWPGAALADITGSARVVDGDTLEIAGQRIRLHGIDAPEIRQTCKAGGITWHCGERATLALFGRIGRNEVRCEEKGRNRYGHIAAVCYAGGTNLNRWMVREGWAVAYHRFFEGYIAAENEARAAERNLWRGEFVLPWEWRRGKRLGDPDEAAPGADT